MFSFNLNFSILEQTPTLKSLGEQLHTIVQQHIAMSYTTTALAETPEATATTTTTTPTETETTGPVTATVTATSAAAVTSPTMTAAVATTAASPTAATSDNNNSKMCVIIASQSQLIRDTVAQYITMMNIEYVSAENTNEVQALVNGMMLNNNIKLVCIYSTFDLTVCTLLHIIYAITLG